MIEEIGLVVGIEGTSAFIQTEARHACGACNAQQSCGTSQLGAVLGQRRNVIRALNKAGARPGEQVVVGIQPQVLLRSSAAVYLAPVMALVMGAGLGTELGQWFDFSGDLPAVAVGMTSLALALFWLRSFNRRIARNPQYQPVVLRTLATGYIPIHPA